MYEEDDILGEMKRRKELSKRSFKKVINKDKLSNFELDEVFNGVC